GALPGELAERLVHAAHRGEERQERPAHGADRPVEALTERAVRADEVHDADGEEGDADPAEKDPLEPARQDGERAEARAEEREEDCVRHVEGRIACAGRPGDAAQALRGYYCAGAA